MEPCEFEFLNPIAVVASNIISIALSGMVVMYAVVVGVVNGGLNSKVSFCLSLGIICIDGLYSVFQAVGVLSSSGWACNLSSVGVVFMTLMSTLLTCALTLNLQLIILHDVTVNSFMRVAYFVVPLLVSLVVSALPLVFGQIGLHWQGEWYS
ncbi:hypothetical protein DSO57_1035649 [Entomophthora muscae]|uniref:Uncharacterized protein n=1 Tax=Entomophthora muscae TaxID=34485 RepID=A0ACC2TY03_9FUNG|nr:hypothetical protein DSO57_1035649 [Entomophthora muscae]